MVEFPLSLLEYNAAKLTFVVKQNFVSPTNNERIYLVLPGEVKGC
jgi:hypothetical protein